MSPGSNTESYPAFAHIGLRENPRKKNLNQVTCPDWESNPGHPVSRLDALTNLNHWQSVLFSDESRYRLARCDGRLRVWGQPRKRLSAACVQEVEKFAERIRSIGEIHDPMGNRNRFLRLWSVVSQPLHYRVPPILASSAARHKSASLSARRPGTTSSQFTVLLSQSLEFTVSRTTDLQRQFTVLELGSLQLRSTALELRPSDADADADTHSSRTPAHKSGLLALAYSLTE
ncbi:hypothetical protein ANN_21019 [Periplaneta americana]|uniref:Uncharacterized protein n=1 Tax=Periplaneta americana TaxID=6978 RepID=A0ABQ8SEC5_PERAM|nr:hypothetical protein ANN_21019 [Periplaneta americana]